MLDLRVLGKRTEENSRTLPAAETSNSRNSRSAAFGDYVIVWSRCISLGLYFACL